MKLSVLFLFIINSSLLFSQNYFEKGMDFYSKRAENAKGNKAPLDNINNALLHFEKSITSENKEISIAYYLKSIYYKSTYCFDEDDKKKKSILDKGKELGAKMIKKYPKHAGIHYWYAVVLGAWAKEHGAFTAAKEGVIDILKTECELVLEIDDNYENGNGYLFLGILYLDAPYIPFFLTWPDDDEAIKIIGKSFKMNPKHISTQYYYAKALNEVGRKEEAIVILEKTIKQKPSHEMVLENISELDLCKSLLNDLK